MTSSSLLVPNSFSSWLLGALSYAPCAPWLFAEKGALVSKGSGDVERVVGSRTIGGGLTCASRRS